MDLIILGLPTAGKTSMIKVVFHKLPLHEVHSIGSSTGVEMTSVSNNPYFQFKIYDIPATINLDEYCKTNIEAIQKCGAVIYVIDAKATPYEKACDHFKQCVAVIMKYLTKVNFEIFIHKVDGDIFTKGDEFKLECQRDIQTFIKNALVSAEIDLTPAYYFTSIYDHTLYESFGKVIQKLWPQVHYIGNMLDGLIYRCRIEKALLFDALSKICLAADSTPTDPQNYGICSDMIDLFIDMSFIYGRDEVERSAFDDESSSIIELNIAGKQEGSTYLMLRQVEKFIALVCIVNEKDLAKKNLINYNIDCFKKGLAEICGKGKAEK